MNNISNEVLDWVRWKLRAPETSIEHSSQSLSDPQVPDQLKIMDNEHAGGKPSRNSYFKKYYQDKKTRMANELEILREQISRLESRMEDTLRNIWELHSKIEWVIVFLVRENRLHHRPGNEWNQDLGPFNQCVYPQNHC